MPLWRSPTERDYLPALDGWRAVAILAVIASHSRFFASIGDGRGTALYDVAGHGGWGVASFFAISGFIICNRLLLELSTRERISLKKIYLRRCFRNLPLYFTYVGLLAIRAAAANLKVARAELIWSVLFARNYLVMPAAVYTGICGHWRSRSISISVGRCC